MKTFRGSYSQNEDHEDLPPLLPWERTIYGWALALPAGVRAGAALLTRSQCHMLSSLLESEWTHSVGAARPRPFVLLHQGTRSIALFRGKNRDYREDCIIITKFLFVLYICECYVYDVRVPVHTRACDHASDHEGL